VAPVKTETVWLGVAEISRLKIICAVMPRGLH
jgi:hypothetical protein